MLEEEPELINTTSSDGCNLLHKAFTGQANLEMIESLLYKKPKLLECKNQEGLTPIMLVEQHGFSKNLSDSQVEQIKNLLIKEYKIEYILTPRTIEMTYDYLNNDFGELLGFIIFEHSKS